MDKKYLFAAEDLHQAKHIPKVVRCLEEIEKLVTSFITCLSDQIPNSESSKKLTHTKKYQ